MKLHDLHQDILSATTLLTRLPVKSDIAYKRPNAVWAYPIVGFTVGLCVMGLGRFLLWLELPVEIAAGLALTLGIFLTGALHEDGLADTADGFWGGWTVERRLEIMRDSRIGTYGVLALILSVGLRWMAIIALLSHAPWILPVAAAASRGSLPVLMSILPPARTDGLSAGVGSPSMTATAIASGLSIFTILCVLPWALLGLGIALLICARLMQVKIKGQTGDSLGATQQVTEMSVLLTAAALLN